jgi:hypothetical protein
MFPDCPGPDDLQNIGSPKSLQTQERTAMAIIDDDLVKAELALAELPRARTAPFDRSLAIIRHLASMTGNNGSRTISVENAQADAWLTICAVGQALENEGHCSGELWDKAMRLTQRWRSLLVG